MANIVDISNFRPESFGICLRRIYRDIDRTFFPSQLHVNAYKDFFIRTRGRFLSISRKKKDISIEEAGSYLGIPFLFLELIENGKAPITDSEFLKLCRYYGTQQEALVLTEKIEAALKSKSNNKIESTENVVIQLLQK